MMKKLLLLLIMILSAFTMNAQNLLAENPGFEGLGGDLYWWWSMYNGSSAGATLTNETTDVHSGSNAAKIEITTPTGNEWEPQLSNGYGIAVTSGENYTIKFWIKAESAGGLVRVSDNGGSGGFPYAGTTAVSTTWEEYSHSFTATDSEIKIAIDLGKSTTANTYYIDDVSLTADATAGLDDINANGIVMYPNPVSDRLFIKSNRLDASSISINDILGRTVRVIDNVQNIESIDVSNLSKGIYILTTDTKKQLKFIKE